MTKSISSELNRIKNFTPALFLYVMYLMILGCIPIGLLSAFNPILAANICLGVKTWLEAIPHNVWELFAAGYLGYSFTKSRETKKL